MEKLVNIAANQLENMMQYDKNYTNKQHMLFSDVAYITLLNFTILTLTSHRHDGLFVLESERIF